MRWEITSLLSAIIIGIFNTALEGNGKAFKKDYIGKLSHVMLFLVVTGIFALFICVYLYYRQKQSMNSAVSFFKNNPLRAIFPGILIPIYLYLNIKAISEGGAVAMSIVNLNIIVTLIGGNMLYNDKIDSTIVITMLLILILTGFLTYHNDNINT